MGSRSYRGKEQFWWIGAPIVKHRDFLPWAVQKRLNQRFAVWVVDSSRRNDAQVQLYSPDGANVPSWEDTLPPPIECDWIIRLRRRCALRQITLTTCYLWTRPLRQSHRWPSTSSRILYCWHSAQYIYLVWIFKFIGYSMDTPWVKMEPPSSCPYNWATGCFITSCYAIANCIHKPQAWCISRVEQPVSGDGNRNVPWATRSLAANYNQYRTCILSSHLKQ